jgi:hypothetical protein
LSINQKFPQVEDGYNATDTSLLSRTNTHTNTLTSGSTNKISGELSRSDQATQKSTALFVKNSEAAHNLGHSQPMDTFATRDDQQNIIHANKQLMFILKYLPNNKCDESVDHHDHENEKEHLHRHGAKNKNNHHHPAASISMSDLPVAKSTSMY